MGYSPWDCIELDTTKRLSTRACNEILSRHSSGRLGDVMGWGDWWRRAFQAERTMELGRALMKMLERAQVMQGCAKKVIIFFLLK